MTWDEVNTNVQRQDRVEYGHTWKWVPAGEIGFVCHWRSMSGNIVRIFPPNPDDLVETWYVAVFDSELQMFAEDHDLHELTGGDAESRAFAIAVGYTSQDRSR